MKADTRTEAAVTATLNQIHEAYARRDSDSLVSLLAPDADVLMFGTGVDEKRVGVAEIRAQAERDWSQTEAAAFEFGPYVVSATGAVAWVAAEGGAHVEVGGQALDLPIRLTAVLERREERWRIVQAHYSAPLANQAEGESFPAQHAESL